MKFLNIIEKNKNFYFLIAISFVFFLLRFPSVFEPHWYGDEGIYQVLGDGINQGRILYRDIWDNKPPLLYLTYALFSSDQFTVRFISLVFGLLSVIAFFFLSKLLFNSKKATFIATFFYTVMFGLPFIEGNIANSENFMLLPIILAGYIIFKSIDNKENQKRKLSFFNFQLSIFNFQLFIAGLFLSVAFLFKIVAIFDFAAFVLFIFFIENNKLKDFFPTVINIFFLILGFVLPVAITALYFLLKDAFPDFFRAAFMQNVGYVGYGNKFVIPQGLLFLKMSLLFLFSAIIFIKRRSFKKTTVFILLWLAFSLFNALFSQRPYTHYLLVLLPAFSLFFGLIFWSKKTLKIYSIIFFLLLIFISQNFSVYGKTNRYYQNFISFILGSKSVYDYRNFFDRNTPKDYELATFINKHTTEKDNIFVWGNNAQLYKLTNKLPPGRFTVAYHMTAKKEYLKETYKALIDANPKFIIITSDKNFIPFPMSGYTKLVSIKNSIIYERNL